MRTRMERGPIDIYGNDPEAKELLVCYIALPQTRATGVLLYRMFTDHLLDIICMATQVLNNTRRAAAQAELRYLGKIRGLRTTARQTIKLEKVPGIDAQHIGAMIRKEIWESAQSTQRKEFVCERINLSRRRSRHST